MTIAEEYVQRGAALLDERGPAGWVDRIDITRLDVALGDKCPLGQLYGRYETGLVLLSMEAGFALSSGHVYGFARSMDADHPSLTVAWRELIARRRLPHVPVSEPAEAIA